MRYIDIAKQVFSDEILALHKISDNLDTNFTDAIIKLANVSGKVIVSGIGKSGHVASKIAATLASTGTPAFYLHPAEALHGDLGMVSAGDAFIAISYSGEALEFINIIPIIKRLQVPVIAITGNNNSSLAKISDVVLNIAVDKEACPLGLAPTSSTTASLVMGDALAVVLLQSKGFSSNDFALSHPGGSLGRKLLTKISDIMHKQDNLPKILADSSVKSAILEINKHKLGMVGVVDNNMKLVGIITDGDIRRLLEKHDNFNNIQVQDIMNHTPKVINSDAMAVDAISTMEEYKITAMAAIDNNGKYVGALNMHDLFSAKLL